MFWDYRMRQIIIINSFSIYLFIYTCIIYVYMWILLCACILENNRLMLVVFHNCLSHKFWREPLLNLYLTDLPSLTCQWIPGVLLPLPPHVGFVVIPHSWLFMLVPSNFLVSSLLPEASPSPEFLSLHIEDHWSITGTMLSTPYLWYLSVFLMCTWCCLWL